jgi:membrane associated rhomboid family serine protease
MHSLGSEGYERAVFQYAAIPQNITGADVTILMHGSIPVAAVQAGFEVRPYLPDFDPARLTARGGRYYYGRTPLETVEQRIPPWMTLFSMMFMHAGWLHLLGNMWFLFVFGPNVEDTLGKFFYPVFYVASGFGATAAQLAHDFDSVIPFLGASGAIAGVMGGFAVRFPGAQVLTLVPIVLYTLAHLPAWIFMLIYIGEQVFMSIVHRAENGGVAWWAHIGGFATGYVLIRFLPVSRHWREVFERRRAAPYA